MEISEFSMEFFSLAGKKAIVTGGNTGLGQAFTLALAKAGADVFVPSVMDDDGKTGPLVEATGRRYEYLKIDVTAPGAGFEHDTNHVVILNADGTEREVPLAEKRAIARAVFDAVLHRRQQP